MTADTVSLDRNSLRELAVRARERRIDEEDGDVHRLKGQCHRNALATSRVLDDASIDHEVVVGVLVGDPIRYDAAEKVRPAGEVAEEHSDDRVPTVLDDVGYVVDAVASDRVAEVGVIHVWVEVDDGERTWIVEPYAEMRGPNEYEAVATPVEPLDYLHIDDHEFDCADLEALVARSAGETGTLRTALFGEAER